MCGIGVVKWDRGGGSLLVRGGGLDDFSKFSVCFWGEVIIMFWRSFFLLLFGEKVAVNDKGVG
jgi:hypothetical protein